MIIIILFFSIIEILRWVIVGVIIKEGFFFDKFLIVYDEILGGD